MSSGGVWHDDDMEPFVDGGPGGQTGAGGLLLDGKDAGRLLLGEGAEGGLFGGEGPGGLFDGEIFATFLIRMKFLRPLMACDLDDEKSVASCQSK
jgi:hypothetical protein